MTWGECFEPTIHKHHAHTGRCLQVGGRQVPEDGCASHLRRSNKKFGVCSTDTDISPSSITDIGSGGCVRISIVEYRLAVGLGDCGL